MVHIDASAQVYLHAATARAWSGAEPWPPPQGATPGAARTRRDAIGRTMAVVEDAFRTASLNGVGAGEIVLVRRLDLGLIRLGAPSQTLALRIEAALRGITPLRLRAGDVAPPDAPAISFHDRAEALAALLIAARRGTLRGWWWARLLPAAAQSDVARADAGRAGGGSARRRFHAGRGHDQPADRDAGTGRRARGGAGRRGRARTVARWPRVHAATRDDKWASRIDRAGAGIWSGRRCGSSRPRHRVGIAVDVA